MKKTMLDKLHSATDAVIEAINWPGRKKAIFRGAESFADDVEALAIKTDMALTAKRKALTTVRDDVEAKAIWKELADLRLRLDDAKALAAIVAEERAFLEADASDDVSD